MEAIETEAETREADRREAEKQVEQSLVGMKVAHAKSEIAEGDTILTLRVSGKRGNLGVGRSVVRCTGKSCGGGGCFGERGIGHRGKTEGN